MRNAVRTPLPHLTKCTALAQEDLIVLEIFPWADDTASGHGYLNDGNKFVRGSDDQDAVQARASDHHSSHNTFFCNRAAIILADG